MNTHTHSRHHPHAHAHTTDMTEGPLLGKLVRYAIPLWLTGLLQIAFHWADMAVIGRFGSSRAMAGIGAIGEIFGLLVCVVVGVSTGSNVVVAQMFGAKDKRGLSRAVHTSIAFALASGIFLMVLGQAMLIPALRWMNVPEDIRQLSLRYMRICFCGLPFSMLTNFACAVLRGVGDSRRPLWYMILGGAVNLVLNILLVAVFHLDVGGVAAATVLSQMLTCALCAWTLIRERGPARLIPKHIRFYPAELKRILWIGAPLGLQFACCCSANVIIQSAINTLGSVTIAGNTAASVPEMALHTWANACLQTVMTAVGQNFGAGNLRRAVRSILLCLLLATASMSVLGVLTVRNGEFLLGLIKSDPDVVARGMVRIRIVLGVYFLRAAMDLLSGALRGFGRSVTPMAVTLVGACGLRVAWVYTAFRSSPTLETLSAAFPLSWLCVSVVNGILLFFVCRALLKGDEKSVILKLVK